MQEEKRVGKGCVRNAKGQFIEINGGQKYKQKIRNGKYVAVSHLVWEKHNDPVPPGMLVHHKNEDKKDNRIENLECITYREHNLLHSHEPWNKGLTAEDERMAKLLQKAIKRRKKNYLARCKLIYDLKNRSGKTYIALSSLFNRSDRQLLTAYKTYERYLKQKGEPIYNAKPFCPQCGQERRLCRKGLCRKCYERQNPNSKFYQKV